MIKEKELRAPSGWVALMVLFPVLIASVVLLIRSAIFQDGRMALASSLVLVVDVFLAFGLFVVNPNEARVLQLFGKYIGSVRDPGLRFANPLYSKKRVSQRVRNFESARLKVNDTDGNPIELAAV